MMITDANPLEDTRALSTPRAVVVRGDVIENPRATPFADIDAQLDGI
jgi:hypothetical protein